MRLLPGCVGMLAGVEPIGARVLEAATQLKAICRNGVGVDNIDPAAAQRLNIQVLKTVGANARGVAELAIGLMFASIRAIPYSDTRIKAGDWSRKKGVEIQGKTLGLIGCGKIGKYVAEMATGLGMQVVAYDMYPDSSFAPSPAFRFASLDEVLHEADVLSLHCPLPEDGRSVIDRDALAKMKSGAYLINTARAALIDEDAVLDALNTGKIAGFATDVFLKEPPEASPLFLHEQVITTSHIGGFTIESVDAVTTMAMENLLNCLQEK